MSVKYVGELETPLKNLHGRRVATLIWGDPVHVLEESGAAARVYARGWEGTVERKALCNRSLLEIYIIDVGQGDGVLLKTPEGKWHLIDAGVPGRVQMTEKGAANFLRWKFLKDLRKDKVTLASAVITHPDYDHYGGFLDVLSGSLVDGRTFDVEVENLYHNGLGRFEDSPELGKREKGEVDALPYAGHKVKRKGAFITEMLTGKTSFRNPPRPFDTNFAELAALIGSVPHHVKMLSHRNEYLPGYAPGDGKVEIRVLGPILESFPGGEGLRWLGSGSQTVNGHSVVLRLDYGKARILLGGDLNARSQRLLLSYYPAGEFEVDVAKGCHHGAEDVYTEFIRALHARATVISSGDNESYSHPRPVLMGASGMYGREAVGGDGASMAPLLYSTELARSVKLAHASSAQMNVKSGRDSRSIVFDPKYIQVRPPGKEERFRSLRSTLLSFDLIYGLVNVRTDGERILCATMKESGNDFDVKVFQAGVEA